MHKREKNWQRSDTEEEEGYGASQENHWIPTGKN